MPADALFQRCAYGGERSAEVFDRAARQFIARSGESAGLSIAQRSAETISL